MGLLGGKTFLESKSLQLLAVTLTREAVASTITESVYLKNPTSATAGQQQNSPSLALEGQGWLSGTSASGAQRWDLYVNPVSNATGFSNFIFRQGGSARMVIESSGLVYANFWQASAGTSVTSISFKLTANSSTNTGFFSQATNAIGVTTNGAERFRWDTNTTASETALLVSVAGGAVQRVSVGANDSGGTGLRALCVANS